MSQDSPNMLDTALARHAAGLCVMPAARRGDKKFPVLKAWTHLQDRLSTCDELRDWFGAGSTQRYDSMCIIAGAVSGNLEMIDFDLSGSAFEPWKAIVDAEAPGLIERLTIETTPSGGSHVVYRCDHPVGGNKKLAMRRFECDGPDKITIEGKNSKPKRDPETGAYFALVTLIETRGEGGMFLCEPSPGYTLVQNGFSDIGVITADERDTLLTAARSLNEAPPKPLEGPPRQYATGAVGLRPGDDFNARGDVRPLLEQTGWRRIRSGENEHWCRPGKDSGTSATLKAGVFYVFTSNAPPFEPSQAYSPFATYTLLQHDGDYSAAARALGMAGFGSSQPLSSPPALSALPSPLQHVPVLPNALSIGTLVSRFTHVRTPVIRGLIREGETMNVIAAPKTGKSWLVLDLAVSVATGGSWLGRFDCEAGEVLILDNELHAETSASRIPLVAKARGVEMSEIVERIYVDNLRGRLIDINALRSVLANVEPGQYKVVVLDAFYRFMPAGMSENDNGAMTGIYNELDRLADRLRCCFVLVHHTNKGSQREKAVTDVGAGAGAQSRATDTHLVLRQHEEEDVIVLDATVRSWPPVEQVCLRRSFPVWNVEAELDPTKVKKTLRRRKSPQSGQSDGWDAERFVAEFISEEPRVRATVLQAAIVGGLSSRRATDLLSLAVESGIAHRWEDGRNRPQQFATVPQPLKDATKEVA